MSSFYDTIAEKHRFIYTEELEFCSESLRQKVMRRCEKKLKKKEHATHNHWTCSLFEKELIEKKPIAFSIEKVHPLVGYGVIAKERIAPLAFVGEYVGEVRRRRFSDRKNEYAFGYVIGPHDTPWVIDAAKKGNFTRFFNHSYTPNLVSRWIISKSIAHIAFFSLRLIEVGEQLTFDYGPYYWRRRPIPHEL